MTGRYTGWHGKSGGAQVPPALRELGKKLLGEIKNAQLLSGTTHNVRRASLPDGSTVTATISHGVPRLEFAPVNPVIQERQPVEIGGFVTWPTDELGNTAIPESVRIIMAGPQYRGVREDKYSPLFPDGLNRAGNVDWHGRGGWVLSWYGPRTRYVDFSCQLKPWVFFKGKPIFDATVAVDTDAVVRGACITRVGNGTHLVVVTEQSNFGDIEEVWIASVTGKPTDIDLVIGTPERILVRDLDENTSANHPWFFNPTGTEARCLRTFAGELIEMTLTLSEEPTDPFISASVGGTTEPDLQRTRSSGYVSATFGMLCGLGQNTRFEEFDLAPYFATGLSTIPPGAEQTNSGTFVISSGDGIMQCTPQAMLDFEYSETIIPVGDPWRRIAVDYDSSGNVVYAHWRGLESTTSRSGGMTAVAPTSAVAFTTGDFTTRSISKGVGLGWEHHVDYNDETSYSSFSTSFEVSSSEQFDAVDGGLRVGSVEVLATRARTSTNTGGGSQSESAAVSGGARSQLVADEPDPVGDPRPKIIFAISDSAPLSEKHSTRGAGAGTRTVSMAGQSQTAQTEVTVYLIHMDLRYDAVFYTRRINATSSAISRTIDYTAAPVVGDSDFTTESTTDISWNTVGYIGGAEVLNETEITFTDSQSATNTNPASTILSSLGTDTMYSFCSWYEDYSVFGTHGNFWGSYPKLSNIISIEGYEPVPITMPYAYQPQVLGTVDPADLFAFRATNLQTPLDFVLDFPTESEPSAGQIIGYTSNSPSGSSAAVKWHRDAEGVASPGSWCYYRGEWMFSMSLPTQGTTNFNFVSRCRIGEAEPRILTLVEQAVVDHLHPVWVLPATKGFRA